MAQSISRAMVRRFPVSIASSARSHSPRTRSLTASAPRLPVKSFALARYSRWMPSALIWRPLASRTWRRPVMSWLTSPMAWTGLSRVRSGIAMPASAMRSTRSVAPALSSAVVSLMVESLTLTRSRRNPAARGSSKVLMNGLGRMAAVDRPSPVYPVRRLRQYTTPRGVRTTAPAPQMSCLVTRNGIRMSASRPNAPPRPIR